jgi:PAS domain S-box-containing protein
LQNFTSKTIIDPEAAIQQQMLDNCLDLICAIDRKGFFVYVSGAGEPILGYGRQELQGQRFIDFVHPNHLTSTPDIIGNMRRIRGGTKFHLEITHCHKSGQEVTLSWSAGWSEKDQLLYCVGREAVEQRPVSRILHEQEEVHQAFIQHGGDIMGLVNEEGKFIYSIGASLQKLGYEPDETLGQYALCFIHEEEQAKASNFLSLVARSQQPVTLSAVRFKAADGSWRWLDVTGTNHLQHPGIRALVLNARDVTERMETRHKLQESEQRFKSLFEHHPDMVLFEDQKGLLRDMNPAFLEYFQQEKGQLVNRVLADLLPVENQAQEKQVRLEALQGLPRRYEIDMQLPLLGRRVFDITKIPVVEGKEIKGLFSIAKDITAISLSNEIIQKQANKLSTIFESITDAFFTLDRNWNFTYINCEFERLLQLDRGIELGRNIWDAFPEEINGTFYQQYHAAAATGKAVYFEAYLQRLDLWLDIKVFPSQEGLSVYFHDSSEKVRTQQELEKLSLVASRTDIGVIITDANCKIEWVNDGFTHNTGYSLEESLGKIPSQLLNSDPADPRTFKFEKEELRKGQPVSFESLNYRKNGEELWHSVQVNPIRNQAGEITRYVATQTNINALKRSELELSELSRDLYRQNQDLQQFTYIVSHNLRAPVANAKGLADLILKAGKDSEVLDISLHHLQTSIYQLDTVLSDLNKILSIRDKKDTPGKEQVELSAQCRQALESHLDSLTACNAQIRLHIPGEIRVQANKYYVYSIFCNLISNAIKYRSRERQLEIDIDWLEQAGQDSVITFSDNGQGFDMEKAGPHIFKLYKRFHAGAEGRGLGLFLVKTQIEALGGSIQVSSKVNEGTRFIIHFK